MNNVDLRKTNMKLQYLDELRKLRETQSFTKDLDRIDERVNAVCKSVERDLDIQTNVSNMSVNVSVVTDKVIKEISEKLKELRICGCTTL